MPILRQWLDLPRADKRLFLAAGCWVVTFRVALWTLPLRFVWELARRGARPRKHRAGADEVLRVNRAISRAARLVPQATCLTQALTMHTLLGRRGIVTQLRIGVTKEPNGRLLAHAWLERDGATLMTTENLDNYRPFPPIPLIPEDAGKA
jgi:hypothetical protein